MSQTEPITTQNQLKRNLKKFVFNCNTYIIILIVLALTIIINLLGARFSYRLDLTKNKLYSLSGQSVQALQELNKQPNKIKIYGFFRTGDGNRRLFEDLFKQYQKRSGKIEYEFIDPIRNPTEAKRLEVQELGTLVVTMGDQKLKLLQSDLFQQSYNGPGAFLGEQAMTRTIYKLIDADVKNIYLLTGHGEKPYEAAQDYLKGQGFEIKTLDLLKDGKFPTDCAQLVIAGPQGDLSRPEVKMLEDYLADGGRIAILLDYTPKRAAIPNLIGLMQEWGIDVTDSLVVELERHAMFDFTTIIPNYQTHEIVNPLLQNNLNLVLPVNRALKKKDLGVGDIYTAVILESSAKSWAETNPTTKNVKQDPGETVGPIPLGLAATRSYNYEGTQKEGRMVVMGTSMFLDVNFAGQGGNLNLYYNMTQWLLGQEDRVSITAKRTDVTQVTLSPAQANMVRIVVLIILPLVILGLGSFIWIRRRAR